MYIPKSKIQTNLYTNGGEYILSSTGKNYTGYYYITSTNAAFTGKNPDVKDSEALVSVEAFDQFPQDYVNNKYTINTLGVDATIQNSKDTNIVTDYLKIKENRETGFNVNKPRQIPSYNPVLPTQKDYNLGVFVRYFCKKRSENSYIEIDKDTFNNLVERDSTIAFDLYRPFKLPWTLTSPNNDKNEVEQTNAKTIKVISVREKTPGLDVYLKFDYTKYYQPI